MTIAFEVCHGQIKIIIDDEIIHSELHKRGFVIEDAPLLVINKILKYPLQNLPDGLQLVGLYTNNVFSPIEWIEVNKSKDGNKLVLSLSFNLEDWAHPFPIKTFMQRFQLALSTAGYYVDPFYIEDGWAFIQLDVSVSTEPSLEEQVHHASQMIAHVHEDIVTALSKTVSREQLVKFFAFPPEYRTICTQYLMWFGEYLEQIGIQALVSVTNHPQNTELSISTYDSDALPADIEQLFHHYLCVPAVPKAPRTSAVISEPERLFLARLTQQVEGYLNQIEMKNTTIVLQQQTIDSQQNQVTTLEAQLLLLRSLQESDDIELFGGALKIGDLQWGPIKLSLKKLLKLARQ